MKKQELDKATNIVRESVHRIDPYSLLESGSPDDEFASEIHALTSQLQYCNSGNDISHAISRVLNSSFSEKHKPEQFEEEGNKIYMALIENSLK